MFVKVSYLKSRRTWNCGKTILLTRKADFLSLSLEKTKNYSISGVKVVFFSYMKSVIFLRLREQALITHIKKKEKNTKYK